jgi:hypothetical protein
MAATFTITARSNPMAMDGDEEQPRRSRPPDLLRFNERYETSSTQQQRSKGGKVTVNEIRPNVVKRADVGAEIVVMKLAVAQMTAAEWQVFIALKEGVLFDPLPPPPPTTAPLPEGLRYRPRTPTLRTWHMVPPPARTATVEQVARHYGMRTETVERYERSARRILHTLRERAGLTAAVPSVPIWPAIMSDERLLRYLYGEG